MNHTSKTILHARHRFHEFNDRSLIVDTETVSSGVLLPLQLVVAGLHLLVQPLLTFLANLLP
jgi:hypothetical protein